MQRKMLIQDAGTLTENETVKNMPVYPQEGYISTVDGVVVVKLANS